MKNTPPKKKRIRNPEQTRERLLKATLDLVAEKGIEALSMKEAASRAGVSRSVAYLHFEDRDDLLKEAREWISAQLQHGVQQFSEDSSLYDRILHTTELVMQNPEASKVMMTDAIAGGGLDLHDPLYSLVLSRIKFLKRKGRLKPGFDPEIATFIHLGSIAATLLYLEQHKGDDVAKLSKKFARVWSRMLEDSMFKDSESG